MEWILHWLVGWMSAREESPFNIMYMVMWGFFGHYCPGPDRSWEARGEVFFISL